MTGLGDVLKQPQWLGTSLAVQWLGLLASTTGGTGSIPGGGTKIPHAVWPKKSNHSGPKGNLSLCFNLRDSTRNRYVSFIL